MYRGQICNLVNQLPEKTSTPNGLLEHHAMALEVDLAKPSHHSSNGLHKNDTLPVDAIILLMAEILHQLIGSLPHDLQGFMDPRWCRISAINSSNSLSDGILVDFRY